MGTAVAGEAADDLALLDTKCLRMYVSICICS